MKTQNLHFREHVRAIFDKAPFIADLGLVLVDLGPGWCETVLQVAKRANLPLLLVKQDTFPALERLEQSTSHLSPGDDVKVRHILELMDFEGALDKLLESLKPPRP